jgi:enterochelin esterase-like enzyme
MAVIEYLRSCGLVSRIGLWGRSMGAATSILVAARDPSIAGMVLDSSFSNLTQVSAGQTACGAAQPICWQALCFAVFLS